MAKTVSLKYGHAVQITFLREQAVNGLCFANRQWGYQDNTSRSFSYPIAFSVRPVIMLTGWYNQVAVEKGESVDHFTYRINDYNGNEHTGVGGCAYLAIGY